MPNKTVVMCSTVQSAIHEWKTYIVRWEPIIKKVNRANLFVELINGDEIFFKGKTEGQRALKGLNAKVIYLDEFVGKQVERSNDAKDSD